MKTWQIPVIAVLLAALPVLSACGWFGGKSEEEKLQEYQQQIQANQQQTEIQQQQMEAIAEQLEEALEEYYEYYYNQ